MKIFRLLLFIAAAGFCAMDLLAADKPGKRVSNLTAMQPGSRALAMGQAFVAVADDASAAFSNPGGLGFLVRQEVTVLQQRSWEDFNSRIMAGYCLCTMAVLWI